MTELEQRACDMRIDIVRMIAEAGSGHPGGSLSCTDILTALYFGGVMDHDPEQPKWEDRDRFVLAKGHAAPALYAGSSRRCASWVRACRAIPTATCARASRFPPALSARACPSPPAWPPA